jgi:hypothetical protein
MIFRLLDHVGEISILKVYGIQRVKNRFGIKPAVEVDVTLLGDDFQPGERFEGALIYNQVPIRQLTKFAGETIAARIETCETRRGGQAPMLSDLSDDELDAVEQLIETMEALR